MVEKNKITLLVATFLSIVVLITIIVKTAAVSIQVQYLVEQLAGLGTTFEENGVNISLAYVSVVLSIIVGIVAILGCLLSIMEVEVKDIKLGSILVLAMAIFLWIGIFIPLLDTSFYYAPYTVYVDIDLLETLLGIGEPIILTIAAVLALLAVYVLSD